jgi:flagellin-specific chaperone FliS
MSNETYLEELQKKAIASSTLWTNARKSAEHAKVIARNLHIPQLTKTANDILKESNEALDSWYEWKKTWIKWKAIRDVHEAQKKASHIITALKKHLQEISQSGIHVFKSITELENELAHLNHNKSAQEIRSFKKIFERLKDSHNAHHEAIHKNINTAIEKFDKEVIQKHLAFLKQEFGE